MKYTLTSIDNSDNCITSISELSICIIPKKGAIIKGIIHRYAEVMLYCKPAYSLSKISEISEDIWLISVLPLIM